MYDQIKSIEQKIKDNKGKFDVDRINILNRSDGSNQLQKFVNTVVEYANSLDHAPQSSLK